MVEPLSLFVDEDETTTTRTIRRHPTTRRRRAGRRARAAVTRRPGRRGARARRRRAGAAVGLVEAAALERDPGGVEHLLEPALAPRAHGERVLGERLDDLEAVAALGAAVFVRGHLGSGSCGVGACGVALAVARCDCQCYPCLSRSKPSVRPRTIAVPCECSPRPFRPVWPRSWWWRPTWSERFPPRSWWRGGGASIPTREGSGNPGATNVLRVAGRRAGAIALVGDLLKGAVPAAVGWAVGGHGLGVACGVAAVVGHVLPATRRFRGGKGVATAAGMAVVLFPAAAAVAAVGFAVAVAHQPRRLARVDRGRRAAPCGGRRLRRSRPRGRRPRGLRGPDRGPASRQHRPAPAGDRAAPRCRRLTRQASGG